MQTTTRPITDSDLDSAISRCAQGVRRATEDDDRSKTFPVIVTIGGQHISVQCVYRDRYARAAALGISPDDLTD